MLELLPPRLEEYDVLMTGQPIWRERLQGVGTLNTDEALALSATGPILRSTGYAWDLRRDQPYLYDEVDFDVNVGTHGDCYDGYAIRPTRFASRCASSNRFSTRCRRAITGCRTRRSPPLASASINRWKRSSTTSRSSPRASRFPRRPMRVSNHPHELGIYMVSDGSSTPYRMHAGPVVHQCPDHATSRDSLIADAVAIISSVDPIMGEVDDELLHRGQFETAHEIISLPRNSRRWSCCCILPRSKRAGSPTTPCVRSPTRHHPAEVKGTGSFYEMFKFHPVGTYMINCQPRLPIARR